MDDLHSRTTEASLSTRTAVLFVHGLGSTHESTWGAPGWHELMDDINYNIIPFELPGHGKSQLPTDDDDATLDAAVALAQREGATSAVGFSAGALLLLRAAVRHPQAFSRLALIGIGDGMWRDPEGFSALAAGLVSEDPDPSLTFLRTLTIRAGNSVKSVAAYTKSAAPPPPPPSLNGVTAEILVLLGENDSVGPADMLMAALPNADIITLPNTDHFRAASAPATMKASVEFFIQ